MPVIASIHRLICLEPLVLAGSTRIYHAEIKERKTPLPHFKLGTTYGRSSGSLQQASIERHRDETIQRERLHSREDIIPRIEGLYGRQQIKSIYPQHAGRQIDSRQVTISSFPLPIQSAFPRSPMLFFLFLLLLLFTHSRFMLNTHLPTTLVQRDTTGSPYRLPQFIQTTGNSFSLPRLLQSRPHKAPAYAPHQQRYLNTRDHTTCNSATIQRYTLCLHDTHICPIATRIPTTQRIILSTLFLLIPTEISQW